eukprot:1158274-Pelagomonas_calceolata.AAC.12
MDDPHLHRGAQGSYQASVFTALRYQALPIEPFFLACLGPRGEVGAIYCAPQSRSLGPQCKRTASAN